MLRLLAFAIFAMHPLLLRSASAADWPQRRGPDNNGVSAETSWTHSWPAEGPVKLWSAEVGTGFSAVVIANGAAFTASNSGDKDMLVSFDALTGKTNWTFAYAEPLKPHMYDGGPNTTPTVRDGKCFFLSRTGKLLALNSMDGSLVWSNNLAAFVEMPNGDWGAGGSPVVDGDRIYVNYGSAVVALHPGKGAAVWKGAIEEKGKFSFTTPLALSFPLKLI